MQILIIIVLILLFLFWVCSPNGHSGVVLYFANIGSGKTTFLSKIAIKEQKKMNKGKSKYKHIVSNALIEGVTYIPNIRELLKQGMVEYTLILIDEGSIIYNNRQQNLTSLEIQNFKLIRHYTTNLIILSQSHDDIDVTVRRLYTEIFLMNRLPLFTLIRPIKKYVGIDEMSHQVVDMYKFKSFFSWRYLYRRPYFKYFNSWWRPSDVKVHDLKDYEIIQPMERKPKKFILSKHVDKKKSL